ncbi:S-4TM family putative pore-forming effector [Streptomyces sp. NBC_00103]|uniref:S-4TM family putative pore-forming effector n=1 Tax=Streptomyces sp. NBC_00103 TaxID=2975653 RepID=UPI00225402FC|nr:S-4TM family putative pore-forming effector [Streptomyces sp. NBC_00103]MCX5369570.1 S-4TM family putative pore-forming effector [Streptomyces sp. NBC_00103]
MMTRQNEDDALRLLIAQRRLYSKAKRWLSLRWFGMLVIGLGAPVISVIWPDLAVVSGAIAGLWIFLGQSFLINAQSAGVTKAAAVQEQFDFYVFGMPSSVNRSALPSIEEIAAVSGPDPELRQVATDEKLMDWYPIDASDPGILTVAISQRANASYSDRLLRSTAIVWTSLTVAWALALIVATVISELSLITFLVGILLPVLPSFLDVVRYVAGIRRAARDRGDLTRSIESRMRASGDSIEGNDLLVWQESLYDLRRSTPLVPDLIYKMKRAVNERVMKTAASQLRQQARRSGTGT